MAAITMPDHYEIIWSEPATATLLSLPCALEKRLRHRVKELADAAALAHHHVMFRGPQRVRLTSGELWLDCVLEPERRAVSVHGGGRTRPPSPVEHARAFV